MEGKNNNNTSQDKNNLKSFIWDNFLNNQFSFIETNIKGQID